MVANLSELIRGNPLITTTRLHFQLKCDYIMMTKRSLPVSYGTLGSDSRGNRRTHTQPYPTGAKRSPLQVMGEQESHEEMIFVLNGLNCPVAFSAIQLISRKCVHIKHSKISNLCPQQGVHKFNTRHISIKYYITTLK
jgi:hypothetical protein